MKPATALLALFLVTAGARGQEQDSKATQALFDRALAYYYAENYDSALVLLRQFRAQYPGSDLAPRAHYNIGYILREQGDVEGARVIFLDILQLPYRDSDPGGHGLMGPPTALYKHYSSVQLAEIYLDEGNFDEAAKYVKLFDKKYPYQHFCGNELSQYAIYRARMYAKVYAGQHNPEGAIRELFPHIFYNGLATNDELVVDLIALLEKTYPREAVVAELQRSVATLRVSQSRKRGETATVELYGITVPVSEEELFSLTNPYATDNLSLPSSGPARFQKAIQDNALYRHFGVR